MTKEDANTLRNHVIRAHRKREIENAMIEGYKAMARDQQLTEDPCFWDTTLYR